MFFKSLIYLYHSIFHYFFGRKHEMLENDTNNFSKAYRPLTVCAMFVLILHCHINICFCNTTKIRMELEFSTNQVVREHSRLHCHSFHGKYALSPGSNFSIGEYMTITLKNSQKRNSYWKLHFNTYLCSYLEDLREQGNRSGTCFFFLLYFQYVSFNIINKFQFSIFCL